MMKERLIWFVILRNDTSEDVFVHKSGIQSLNNGMPSLDDGEPVEFDLYNGNIHA